MQRSGSGDDKGPEDPGTTQELIRRIHGGDARAREELFRRYYPRMMRIAHGSLPAATRGLNQTADLVQNTFTRALNGLDRFEFRREGAFLAWLRAIMVSEVQDQLRKAKRRPVGSPVADELPDGGPTPLESAIDAEKREFYEEALAALPDASRQAVIMRLEYGMSYAEIASALERPSPNATRMMIQRAMLRMAWTMRALEEGK